MPGFDTDYWADVAILDLAEGHVVDPAEPTLAGEPGTSHRSHDAGVDVGRRGAGPTGPPTRAHRRRRSAAVAVAVLAIAVGLVWWWAVARGAPGTDSDATAIRGRSTIEIDGELDLLLDLRCEVVEGILRLSGTDGDGRSLEGALTEQAAGTLRIDDRSRTWTAGTAVKLPIAAERTASGATGTAAFLPVDQDGRRTGDPVPGRFDLRCSEP